MMRLNDSGLIYEFYPLHPKNVFFLFEGFPFSPPDSIKDNPNITLHFEVDKISMKDFSSGQDKLTWGLSDHITETSKTFTPPGSSKFILLERDFPLEEVKKQKLKEMPGFRFNWYYSGIEDEPLASKNDEYYEYYEYEDSTTAFVRNVSILSKFYNFHSIRKPIWPCSKFFFYK